MEIYGDSSGYQRRTSGTSTDWALIREFFNRFYAFYRPSIHAASSNPAVRERVNCVNSRLCNALDEHHLYIDPRCRELIKDLEQVTWALDAAGRPTTELDKSDRARTHCSDALGYYIAPPPRGLPILRQVLGPEAIGAAPVPQ